MAKSRHSRNCQDRGGVCQLHQRMMARPRLLVAHFVAMDPFTNPVPVCHPSPSTMRPLRLRIPLDPRHELSKCYITKFHRISSMEAIPDIEKWIHLRVQIQSNPSLARVTGLLYRPLLAYVILPPFILILPSLILSFSPKEDTLSQEFDDMMRSGSTMKVSLTPDRLRTMEVRTLYSLLIVVSC
jgi:hypothetical protein